MARFIAATRLQFICPCGNNQQLRAVNSIIAFLLGEKVLQDWGGFTYSDRRRPAFSGQFWDKDKRNLDGTLGDWQEDKNVLVYIDAPEQSPDAVLPYLAIVRDRMNEVYQVQGEPQKEIWVTVQGLRIVTD